MTRNEIDTDGCWIQRLFLCNGGFNVIRYYLVGPTCQSLFYPLLVRPSSIVPHLFSHFLFLFVALIFFFSPRRGAPVAARPWTTTPSAQRRPSEMAPRTPEAAHSPQYDVRRRCSSTGHAASTPPAARPHRFCSVRSHRCRVLCRCCSAGTSKRPDLTRRSLPLLSFA